ncbi:S-layer homology domain-containing protein [Laspinema olomoucense]|uniref:S-layer homology domain-containing protein n=1 Tax=Laspinema olomoucense TaxID=3231600 RepID=UPI0021BB3EDF|nr:MULTISPECIES: S-layer homology domain-containing protein [unclassified Laspinema]MCT7973742.1 S-layer homology domain-containing protein [Laspinema sp. D3d]MCT7995156.1 S-layer homology domain-containing protein [Laspinema sp. D3c]
MMPQTHSNQTPIERVLSMGWMSNPAGDKTFDFTASVTRSELAQVLGKAFKLDQRSTAQNSAVSVQDLTGDRPDYAAIQIALKTGTMTVDSQGRFFPDRPVNRAEGLAIFAQAYGVFQLSEDAVTELLKAHPDALDIPDWAKQAMATALQEGFVNTDTNQAIRPLEPMTRADLAYALIQYLEKQQNPAFV